MSENSEEKPAVSVEYGDDAIETLSDVAQIRLRPGMYIGRLGNGSHEDDGIYILLKEIIDNAVDEFTMRCGRRIDVSVNADGLASVRDYGRGIPLGKMVDCVSLKNTGGKYNSKSFQFSIGMNGVGTKAVNALSRHFLVRSTRDGQFREAVFSRGELLKDFTGTTEERNGTYVEFIPDEEKFVGFKFNLEFVKKRLWNYAYLNNGLSLYLNGERYFSANGLRDLLEAKISADKLYDVIYYRSKMLEFAFTHTDVYGENSYSFVNGQYTSDGGTHLSAFKEGVLKGIKEFSGKTNSSDDFRNAVRDGMVGAVAVRVQEPMFESQTKNKLGNTDIRGPIVAEVSAAVADFLHRNLPVAETLMDKIKRNEQMHQQIQSVKKKSREVSQRTTLRIPKLQDCKYHVGSSWPKKSVPKETMIFITEGDSAAGALVKRRDVECQAIFALRGKIKNACGEKFDMIYDNAELTYLMQALGIENSTDDLRYDKVIIATDADVDGMHIRNLILTFFLSFFEAVVLRGHLFVLETPLFRVRRSREEQIFCYSEAERDRAVKKLGEKAAITRFKGLGEIDPEDFGKFIGESMRLTPVTLDNMRGVKEILNFYMGDNTPERREYILSHLEVDDYE